MKLLCPLLGALAVSASTQLERDLPCKCQFQSHSESGVNVTEGVKLGYSVKLGLGVNLKGCCNVAPFRVGHLVLMV